MKLCWNGIVKNESARIERMLKSIAPHISSYSVLDTGSSDNTREIITDFFASRDIPGRVHVGEFVNWEQARNAALTYARTDKRQISYDYLLLVDADMELVVPSGAFPELTGVCYSMEQRTGSLRYQNARLLRADSLAVYRGVTHEYLDFGAHADALEGPYFIDHADGANRPNKFKRDIKLLRDGLRAEPANSRYMFYLAQSYRDSGDNKRAASWFRKCMDAGGWDEQVWNAHVNYACCLRSMGDEAGFVLETLKAYSRRPSRAEPLYDLTKFFREKDRDQAAALLFADAGRKIPEPKDLLFVNHEVYATGFLQETAITAFYVNGRREDGFIACDKLALMRDVPDHVRQEAKNNLIHYMEPLKSYCPSFKATRIPFDKPGWTAMNPSVTVHNRDVVVNLRTVNYVMDGQGRYLINSSTGGEANNSNPIVTRNYLFPYVGAEPREVLAPEDFPRPAQFPPVIGLEDTRLFSWENELWSISNVRELNPEGYCEQVVAKLDYNHPNQYRWGDWKVIRPPVRAHEKNWMPAPGGRFVYKLDQMIDMGGKMTLRLDLPWDVGDIRGGSQLVPWDGTGYLAIVHEARHFADGTRYYQHRFVWFTAQNLRPVYISRPFYLNEKAIEFVAGACIHPRTGKLLISYGVRDKEAWIAEVHAADVTRFLWGNV